MGLEAWDHVAEANSGHRDETEVGSLERFPVFPFSEQQRPHEDEANNEEECDGQGHRDLVVLVLFVFLVVVVVVDDGGSLLVHLVLFGGVVVGVAHARVPRVLGPTSGARADVLDVVVFALPEAAAAAHLRVQEPESVRHDVTHVG